MATNYGILRAIEKYGSPACIDGRIEPVIFRSLRKTQGGAEEYWCAVRPGSGLRPGSRMQYGEKHLVAVRADCQRLSGEILYEWAVLREEQGAPALG